MRSTLVVATSIVALALPATAGAHSRGPAIALDVRVRIDTHARGVAVRVLDGDRALKVTRAGARDVVVLGYLGEPVLRFAGGSVWANRASPTAAADRIVTAGRGWRVVAHGRSFAWHDHRLSPPSTGGSGAVGRSSVPLRVDGWRTAIDGTFWRVVRPSAVPWLAAAAAGVAAVAAVAAVVPRRRRSLAIALAAVSSAAAILAVGAFAVRDAPTGGVQWFQLAGGLVVAVACAAVLALTHGGRRVAAAGVIGALAAATMLSALPIYWHGVVISALPATAARLVCGVALVGGIGAGVVSFLADASVERVR